MGCLFCVACMPVSGDNRLKAGIDHFAGQRYAEALDIFSALATKGMMRQAFTSA